MENGFVIQIAVVLSYTKYPWRGGMGLPFNGKLQTHLLSHVK